MKLYAYIFKNPKSSDIPEYYIYAKSQKDAEKKFQKRFGVEGVFLRRETW